MKHVAVIVRIDGMGVLEDAIKYDVREEDLDEFISFVAEGVLSIGVPEHSRVMWVRKPEEGIHVGYVLGFDGDFRATFNPKNTAQDLSGLPDAMEELRHTAEKIAAAGYFGVRTLADLFQVEDRLEAKKKKGWKPT